MNRRKEKKNILLFKKHISFIINHAYLSLSPFWERYSKRIDFSLLLGCLKKKKKRNSLGWVQKVKYYSVITDSAPDVSPLEQFTLFARFVNTGTVKLHERSITVSAQKVKECLSAL